MVNKIPVLLFGDHIAAYGAIRGLRLENIPIYLVSRKGKGCATNSRFVKKIFFLEPVEEGLVDKLSQLAEEIGGEAVLMVAGDDTYLDLLSKNISVLPDGFRCTFHNWDVVSAVRQKYITYQKCAEIGVGFPKTYYVRSNNELEDVLSKLEIEFPILLRTERSREFIEQFNTKAVISNDKQEVIKAYHEYDQFLGCLLLSEYIPGGEEQLVNLIAVGDRRGQPVEVFMNRKVRSSAQFLGCTVMENYYNDRLLEDSLKLMSHLGYYGYCNPEFKIDPRDGSLRLMEINGRITLSVSHALRFGFNLPYAMYNCAMGTVKDKPRIYSCNSGDRILWWEPTSDLFAFFRLFLDGRLTFGEYLKSLRANSRIMEPFWWKDPKVGLLSIWKLILKIFGSLGRRLCRR